MQSDSRPRCPEPLVVWHVGGDFLCFRDKDKTGLDLALPFPSSFTSLPRGPLLPSYFTLLISTIYSQASLTPPCLWTCTLPQLYETRSLLAHSCLPGKPQTALSRDTSSSFLLRPKKHTQNLAALYPRSRLQRYHPLSPPTSQFRASEWQRPRPLRRCRRWGDRIKPCFSSHG